jgi:hypothetical protein
VGDIAYVNGVAGRREPGNQTGGVPAPEELGGEGRVEVKGSLSTKMDAVVRRVLWVTENVSRSTRTFSLCLSTPRTTWSYVFCC